MKAISETQLKLRDAGIQMKLAVQHIGDDAIFRSCVNAFITASRSILEVMKEESLCNEQLLNWYDTQVLALKGIPVERFFFQQRELTMHRGNVKPRLLTAPITNMMLNGEKLFDKGTMFVWRFDGIDKYMPGSSGNVVKLCEQHFLLLKQLVHAWLAQREIRRL